MRSGRNGQRPVRKSGHAQRRLQTNASEGVEPWPTIASSDITIMAARQLAVRQRVMRTLYPLASSALAFRLGALFSLLFPGASLAIPQAFSA